MIEGLAAQRPAVREQHSLANRVLVYCPFSTLSARIEGRNKAAEESGDWSDLRSGVFPFMQFVEIYGPKKEGQRALEVLDRATVIETFHKHYPPPPPEGKDDPGYLRDIEDCERELEGFLLTLGLTPESPRVEVAPRFEGYRIINTGVQSAAECARVLLGQKDG